MGVFEPMGSVLYPSLNPLYLYPAIQRSTPIRKTQDLYTTVLDPTSETLRLGIAVFIYRRGLVPREAKSRKRGWEMGGTFGILRNRYSYRGASVDDGCRQWEQRSIAGVSGGFREES